MIPIIIPANTLSFSEAVPEIIFSTGTVAVMPTDAIVVKTTMHAATAMEIIFLRELSGDIEAYIPKHIASGIDPAIIVGFEYEMLYRQSEKTDDSIFEHIAETMRSATTINTDTENRTRQKPHMKSIFTLFMTNPPVCRRTKTVRQSDRRLSGCCRRS